MPFPLINLNKMETKASTNNTCIKPPILKAKTPIAQPINKTIAIRYNKLLIIVIFLVHYKFIPTDRF